MGLVETYRRILLKLQKSAWKTKIAAKAFRWIACAQRPLQVDELREAIEHEKSDTSWRSAASIDDKQLIRSFGALVCMDIGDRTIRFVHHTVLQFLFSTEEIPSPFHFSRAQAHCFVGEMCVVYLSFSDFETSLKHRPPERKVRDTAIFEAGAMLTIPNILGVGKSLFRVAYRFYGGKEATTGPTIDHDKLLSTLHKPVEAIEPVSSMLARKYRLLDYVVTYWDYHTKWLEANRATFRSFRDLALYKSLPFHFRKWGLNEHHGSYGCNSCEPGSSDDASQELPFTTLIHYAAQIGHVPLLRLFRYEEGRPGLKGYLVHEHCRLFLVACFNDQVDVVEHLLHNYADYLDENTVRKALDGAIFGGHENTFRILLPYVSRLGASLSAALTIAIHQGNASCAEQLIAAGAGFDVLMSDHRIALQAAIEGESDSTIAMLVQRDQLNVEDILDDCNQVPMWGDPVFRRLAPVPRGLMYTAMRGLTLTLNSMIQRGVPVDDMGHLGKTALHYAAERGYSGAIRVLLEHGSEVNAYASRDSVDSDGLTALHLAASNGHNHAVQILCEHGARVNEASNRYAFTPLHLAARNGHPDTIRKLLEYGADLNHEDHAGRTALDLAIGYNKRDAETCLRELGARALQVWTRTSRGAFS